MFEECDAVLSVAAPTIAPLINESTNVRFGVSSFAEEHMQLTKFLWLSKYYTSTRKSRFYACGCEFNLQAF